MTTDKPPYWSHPEGKPGTWARVLCCGGCYQPMSGTYANDPTPTHRLATCQNTKCDQFGTIWQIPKDEGTPHGM